MMLGTGGIDIFNNLILYDKKIETKRTSSGIAFAMGIIPFARK
jgi:hypothetical protein